MTFSIETATLESARLLRSEILYTRSDVEYADAGDRMEAVVCGIDPGLGVTGYAVVRAEGTQRFIADAGVCRFDESLPLARRLADIEHDVTAILSEHKPDFVAVEDLYAHYKHPRTAVLMGHARGVMLMAAAKQNIDVHSYAATRIKRFMTGNGRATKMQMQRAVQATLGLPDLPDPPDVADALAIALCCLSDVENPASMEFAR